VEGETEKFSIGLEIDQKFWRNKDGRGEGR